MIILTGDIHGDISRLIQNNDPKNPINVLDEKDTVIILGDFGLPWNEPPSSNELAALEYLENAPFTTLFIDGNHENYPRLQSLPTVSGYGGSLGMLNNSVYHLKRGEIYTIQGMKFLTFGGAKSIDRSYRVKGVSWYENEIPSIKDEQNALKNIVQLGNEVDFVLTHTLPSDGMRMFNDKYGTSGIRQFGHRTFHDPTSDILQRIKGAIKYNKWYAGHLHKDVQLGEYRLLWQNLIILEK